MTFQCFMLLFPQWLGSHDWIPGVWPLYILLNFPQSKNYLWLILGSTTFSNWAYPHGMEPLQNSKGSARGAREASFWRGRLPRARGPLSIEILTSYQDLDHSLVLRLISRTQPRNIPHTIQNSRLWNCSFWSWTYRKKMSGTTGGQDIHVLSAREFQR